MLPSETMIWQPEFTDKTLSRKPGAVQVASGDVYNSGYGLFPSEQARKDWQNARKKLSRAKLKKPVVVDPDLIWSLPDGEIRRYDRQLNIICSECRNSEVMQRVLIFYTGVMME
ncbi:DUF977 family protein [Escherichia coli]|nr:DUF977 family protein [Escherichia coli]